MTPDLREERFIFFFNYYSSLFLFCLKTVFLVLACWPLSSVLSVDKASQFVPLVNQQVLGLGESPVLILFPPCSSWLFPTFPVPFFFNHLYVVFIIHRSQPFIFLCACEVHLLSFFLVCSLCAEFLFLCAAILPCYQLFLLHYLITPLFYLCGHMLQRCSQVFTTHIMSN